MFATWLDSNSWLLEIAGIRILVDPWLVGALVFGHQDWLFKGVHPVERSVPADIDLILLTQGLPDHAHGPTLERLDRSIPVLASPNGGRAVAPFNYASVTQLDHGEIYRIADRLEIKAVPGTPVGPTLVENGYVIRDLTTGQSLFYEPHGFHQDSLQQEGPIDVVITPILDLVLPVVGAIIRGQKGALELAQWLHPQVILPTADAGEAIYSGLLASLLKTVGGATSLQAELDRQGYSTRVLQPQVGERLSLNLIPQSAPLQS